MIQFHFGVSSSSSFQTERWIAHTWFLSHEELSFDVYYSCVSLCPISHHSKFNRLHNWLTRSPCHKCSSESAHILGDFGWACMCVWVNHNIAGAKQCNQSLFILSECTACVCVCDFQLIDLFFFFYKFRSSKNYIVHTNTQAQHTERNTLSFPLLFLCVEFLGEQMAWCAGADDVNVSFPFRCGPSMHFRAYSERDLFIMWSGI